MTHENHEKVEKNKNMKTVILREPIDYGDERITELHIKKPKARHLRAMPIDPNTGDLLDLSARLAGHPPSVIDELCMSDMTEVLGIVGNFIDAGPQTGVKR